MKRHLLILIISIVSIQLKAQIGINTDTPDTSAILDISTGAHKGGLLIPRLDELQRINIFQPKKSLLIFETTSESFLWNVSGKEWSVLNPWRQKVGVTSIEDSVISPDVAKAKEFVGYGTIPYGGIIMWSGDPLDLPDGWQLCDGSSYTDKDSNLQNTPDLRGRFIVGYDGGDPDYDATGKVGGDKEVLLLLEHMPSHSHEVEDLGHTHSVNVDVAQGKQVGKNSGNGEKAAQPFNQNIPSSRSKAVISEKTKGGDQHHENRPPYYVLAFIMRVK